LSAEVPHTPLTAAAAVVRNPLSVIALFVLLVEAIATFTLVQVSTMSEIAVPLVWFVVVFPTLIALLFFGTLWWRHQFLYSPMEYRSDESFLTAMQRLKRVEAIQDAAELNPQTADEEDSFRVVDRLLQLGDVRAAVKVGRTFLEADQHDVAAKMFQHILDRTPSQHEARYNVYANLGYSQIGVGEFDDAVESLGESIKLAGKDATRIWHNLALAYAHFRLSKKKSDAQFKHFENYLAKAKKDNRWNGLRGFYKRLYPEISSYLV